MAAPVLPQALPDDPSRQTAVAPARDPDIPPPAVAPVPEAAASPAAGEPRYPGLGARTEQDHLAIADELGVKAPGFSQAEQPERFAAWSDRVDQLLIHAQRDEPEQFEALKRDANAYGGHPQPAEPLERPTPQGLREITQAPGVDAPETPEAASAGRGHPESRQPGAIADSQNRMAPFEAPEKPPHDPAAAPQAAGPSAVKPDRTSAPAAPADPGKPAQADATIPTAPAKLVSQAPAEAAKASAAAAAQPEQQTTARIPGVATLAINTLADALRRKEPQPATAATSTAADVKTPPPQPSPVDADRDAADALALTSLLKNFHRQQPRAETAAPDASSERGRDAKSAVDIEAAAAASPPPPGGARDKLALYDAARMQSRRDIEQIDGAAKTGAGVLQSVAALEQQQSASILSRIRDAAEASGGIERVLSEMRPGGAYEDLRKEFNAVLSRDEGFAAAYDKAAGALAGYVSERADVSSIVKARPQTSLAHLETLDQDIVKAVAHLPGKENDAGMLDEALETAFAAVREAFGPDPGQTVRGPSPGPSLGR